MGAMTDISPHAQATREASRNTDGTFGAQVHTSPDITLSSPSNPADTWAQEFTVADQNVDALIPEVERRFRDLIREKHPDAADVNIKLAYDTDGDALVYISDIDGEEIDDDFYLAEAVGVLRTYGYHHDRLEKMSCTAGEHGDFTFDLNKIEGEALDADEFLTASENAWQPWLRSATLVPAIADEVGARHGLDELVFEFTDTDEGDRVTLRSAAGDELDEADLLGAMNSYVTARADMRMFPGFVQDEDDEWTFRYRLTA